MEKAQILWKCVDLDFINLKGSSNYFSVAENMKSRSGEGIKNLHQLECSESEKLVNSNNLSNAPLNKENQERY